MRQKNIYAVLLPLVLCAGLIGGIFMGRYLERRTLSPAQEKLRTVLGLIDKDYVDRIDVDSLLEASLPDILAQLDPHSAYIPASDLKDVNNDLESSFQGVGVSFQILNDTVTVVEVIPGGPAEKVGLQPGDRIVTANGTQLTGKDVTNDLVFKTLRGPADTPVRLKIKRSTSPKLLDYEVVRGEIPVNSVDCVYMIADGIGYVKVSKFARSTYDEFFTALTELRSKGAQRYVVDLRGNSGGYMDQAIYMANEFLPKGRMIVYTKGRNAENETVAVSDGNGSFQNAELTILTDEYSASASEIFAGAMQDNDRGLVVGRRTFGKGLVQNQTELRDSSAIRLTVARYYTPSGRSIQKEYKRGKDGKYELDIVDRYNHGEFYSADSIRQDKSKTFKTLLSGRTVYGGGGIMPDLFVPQDTTGVTSYYINVMNQGLIQKYAFDIAERYRALLKGVTDVRQMLNIIPDDDSLLEGFVYYAVGKGVPARWYYINQSRNLILTQLKAVIARDILGYDDYIRVLNDDDPTLWQAVEQLEAGKAPVLIPFSGKVRSGKKVPGAGTRR